MPVVHIKGSGNGIKPLVEGPGIDSMALIPDDKTIYFKVGSAYARDPNSFPTDIIALHDEDYIESIPTGNWTFTIDHIVVYLDGVAVFPQ